MKKQVRIGVAGFGGIGNYHAMGIRANPHAEIVAIQDANPGALQRARESFPEAAVHESFEAFLDTPRLDGIVIGTPNHLHAEYSIAALKHGLHVMCEKPIAMNPKEAARMVKAVRQSRRIGMTNFGYREVPAFRFARDLFKRGEFGTVHRVHAQFLQGFLRDPNAPINWRNQKQYAGYGSMGDLGSHMIDAVRFITGASPRRAVGVHKVNVRTKINPATGKPARVTADTDSQFFVDYGGFVASFETSQVDYGRDVPPRIVLNGSKGTFCVSCADRMACELAVDGGGSKKSLPAQWTRIEVPKKYRSEIPFGNHFILAIRRELRDYPTFEDGRIAQVTLDAIDRSMHTKKWETINLSLR